MADISNYDDIIDSRDVIERIDELETDALDDETLELDLDRLTDDEREEYAALQSLAAQGEDYAADWRYGETLIRDSYFEDYARQLADDIGAIDSNANWPLNHIDWEAAAEALLIDYTSIDYDGVTYWVR